MLQSCKLKNIASDSFLPISFLCKIKQVNAFTTPPRMQSHGGYSQSYIWTCATVKDTVFRQFRLG